MPQVLKTPSDFAESVYIAGVGVLGPNGKGGQTLEHASLSMAEFQNDQGEPLEGTELTSAGKEYAKGRNDMVVENVSKETVEGFSAELGAAPDRPPLAEVAQEEYKTTFAGLEPVNTSPDVETGAVAPSSVEPAAADSAWNTPGADTSERG